MVDETKVSNDVAMGTDEYSEYMDIIDLPIALYGGTRTMKAKGKVYLPQEEEETYTSYTNRLNRTVLLNVYKRTIQKMSGEVFSRPILFNPDLPPELEYFSHNVDLLNNNINRFSRRWFESGLRDGCCHVLVDAPELNISEDTEGIKYVNVDKTPVRLTDEVLKNINWRPFWSVIPASNVIGYRTVNVNGELVLDQIRIKDFYYRPSGDYGVEYVNRIRVINRNSFEIWENVVTRPKLVQSSYKQYETIEHDRFELIKDGKTNLGFIPLVTFMPGEPLSRMAATPPLEGLAFLNLLHWQSSSDQRNVLHYARMVTFFGKGLQLDQEKTKDGRIAFGANRLFHTEVEYGDLKVVEHSGHAIQSGRDDLRDLETQMALFGLTFMLPKMSAVSATERFLDYSENQSSLRNWAGDMDDAIEKALNMTMKYYGAMFDGKVDCNKDYKNFLTEQDGRVLIEAATAGILSKELVFDEFKRRGMVSDIHDFDGMVEQMRNEQYNMPNNGIFNDVNYDATASTK